jgi:hypothetical protein
MKKDQVRNIIEATLQQGSKTPSLFDLPKILSVKTKLENCASVAEVLAVFEEHKTFIAKSFGLSDAALDTSVNKIQALQQKH